MLCLEYDMAHYIYLPRLRNKVLNTTVEAIVIVGNAWVFIRLADT